MKKHSNTKTLNRSATREKTGNFIAAVFIMLILIVLAGVYFANAKESATMDYKETATELNISHTDNEEGFIKKIDE